MSEYASMLEKTGLMATSPGKPGYNFKFLTYFLTFENHLKMALRRIMGTASLLRASFMMFLDDTLGDYVRIALRKIPGSHFSSKSRKSICFRTIRSQPFGNDS